MAWTMCYAPCGGRERDTKKTRLLRLGVSNNGFTGRKSKIEYCELQCIERKPQRRHREAGTSDLGQQRWGSSQILDSSNSVK